MRGLEIQWSFSLAVINKVVFLLDLCRCPFLVEMFNFETNNLTHLELGQWLGRT